MCGTVGPIAIELLIGPLEYEVHYEIIMVQKLRAEIHNEPRLEVRFNYNLCPCKVDMN